MTELEKQKQMKYLKIENDGLLDARLIPLMGGTTKSSDTRKIGQFGTGLKYVLAYFLRNDIDFVFAIDGVRVEISSIEQEIQGETFKILTIDGEKTSITDRMGLDWKPWMIVRELYSNALDEGGANYGIVDDDKFLEKGKTTFGIEMTHEFIEVYNDWNNYFIVNHVPMCENERFAIHPASGPLRLYKHGILIHEGKETSLFNYDIKDASINELREYKGHISSDISQIIFEIDDQKTIKYLLENLTEKGSDDSNLFESMIDFEFWQDHRHMNDAWKEIIGNAKVIHSAAKKKIKSKNININLDHTIEVPKNLYKALTRCFEGIGALRMADKVNEFYEVHDEDLNLKLKQCIAILENAGYFIHPELTFAFGEFGQKNTMARIDMDAKQILISQKNKDRSLFDFCAMLIEENEHFRTGMSDETREFQQHFINLYTKTMLERAGVKL